MTHLENSHAPSIQFLHYVPICLHRSGAHDDFRCSVLVCTISRDVGLKSRHISPYFCDILGLWLWRAISCNHRKLVNPNTNRCESGSNPEKITQHAVKNSFWTVYSAYGKSTFVPIRGQYNDVTFALILLTASMKIPGSSMIWCERILPIHAFCSTNVKTACIHISEGLQFYRDLDGATEPPVAEC